MDHLPGKSGTAAFVRFRTDFIACKCTDLSTVGVYCGIIRCEGRAFCDAHQRTTIRLDVIEACKEWLWVSVHWSSRIVCIVPVWVPVR